MGVAPGNEGFEDDANGDPFIAIDTGVNKDNNNNNVCFVTRLRTVIFIQYTYTICILKQTSRI
jgi:hypothetical protein